MNANATKLNRVSHRLPLQVRWPYVTFVAVAMGLFAAGATEYLVIPNELQHQEGRMGARFPFDAGFPLRYQQVFEASQFGAFVPGSPITEIRFRQDGSPHSQARSFDVVIPDVEIRLSTSPKTPSTLSLLYEENSGSDETVVFPRGPLHLSAGFQLGELNPFEIVIPLRQSFYYDPSEGSLLMDVFFRSYVFTSQFDADSGPWFSSLAGPVDAAYADRDLRFDYFGMVVQFGFQPIPEPSILLLSALGLAAGLCQLWFVPSIGRFRKEPKSKCRCSTH